VKGDEMAYKFVKDVKDIRGLRSVLNIDFSPKKTCNYDCVTCVSGRTNYLTGDRKEFYPAEDVFSEIKSYIEANGAPEHILLTGSGEPTLYAGFGKLARMIKDKFPDLKVLVYSNFTLLHREEVRREVALCDLVWGNFNTVIEDEFSKMYRPHESVKLPDVIDGMKKFRVDYNGNFTIDTRFLTGINDTDKNINGLRELMISLNPSKYHVIDAKYGGQTLREDFIGMLKKTFEGLPFTVEYHI
jgi:wyosine [tRNA(Phe)-imidazoG37] synthetase (radical SAM superfamily)